MRKMWMAPLIIVLLAVCASITSAEENTTTPPVTYLDMSNRSVQPSEYTEELDGVKFDKDINNVNNFDVTKNKDESITIELENKREEVHKQTIGIPLSEIPGFEQYLEIQHYNDAGILDHVTIAEPRVVDDVAYVDVEFSSVTIYPRYSVLVNWNFENWSSGTTTPDNWTLRSSGGSQSTDAKLGTYSYKITGGGAVRGEIQQTQPAANPGYRIAGAWIKVTGATSGVLNFDFYDETSSTKIDTAGASWSSNTDWRWVEYRENVTASPTSSSRARIFVDSTPNAGSAWYIDGVILSLGDTISATETVTTTTAIQNITNYQITAVQPIATFLMWFDTIDIDFDDGYTVVASVDGVARTNWTADNIVYIDTSGLSTGSHYITITVTNPNPLISNFSADQTNIDVGTSVQFTDNSAGSPNTWLWNFGDGTTSTLQNPSHTYSTGGNYTVNLTASKTTGWIASSSKVLTNYIKASEDIEAAFSAAPTRTIIGETVYFNDLSTGTGIDSWYWDFGDGNNSTAQSPTHTYNELGTYNVSLRVSSTSTGATDTENKTNYITVQNVPIADFAAYPTEGDIPLTVQFTDTSTGATPTSWYWDFGDDGTSVSQNPSHTYGAIGTYTVELTVSNDAGTSTSTQVGCIRTGSYDLGARVSYKTTHIDDTYGVNFTDTSVGDIVSRSWNFGDGNISTEADVSHTYSAPGTYTVTLTVVDSGGNSITQTSEIIVGDELPPENYSQYATKMFTPNMTIWDFPQNAMGVYTSFIPVDLFWLIIMIIMFLPLYIRTGSVLLPCVIYLFIGGFCAFFMPVYFSTMALWMTLLGAIGTIYKLFIEE